MSAATVREQQMDQAILQVLDSNGTQFGLSVQAIALHLRYYGLAARAEEIRKRLFYLSDEAIGYVALVNKGEFHPEAAAWRLTAKGTNHLRLQDDE